jgi:hypothetical protein
MQDRASWAIGFPAVSSVLAVKFEFAEAAHGHFPAEAHEVQETVVEIAQDDVKIGRKHP